MIAISAKPKRVENPRRTSWVSSELTTRNLLLQNLLIPRMNLDMMPTAHAGWKVLVDPRKVLVFVAAGALVLQVTMVTTRTLTKLARL